MYKKIALVVCIMLSSFSAQAAEQRNVSRRQGMSCWKLAVLALGISGAAQAATQPALVTGYDVAISAPKAGVVVGARDYYETQALCTLPYATVEDSEKYVAGVVAGKLGLKEVTVTLTPTGKYYCSENNHGLTQCSWGCHKNPSTLVVTKKSK